MKASIKTLPAGRQGKVSVIMSVYNGIPYLQAAVKSILKQTYKNFDFIIVDDASTDSSLAYLMSLKDKRVKIIKNKKNQGLATSLNKALKVTSGDYIARMDADDISLPNRFEEQIKFLIKHPQIDLCGTWVDLINEKGEIIGEKKYPSKDSRIKKALWWYQPIIHPTLMAKTVFFKKLKGYNPEFDMAEDYELMIRAKNKFKMANISRKLLLWRLWEKRRSRLDMAKMDRIDLKIKLEALKKGYFGPLYFLVVAKKILTTFFLPSSLKVKIAKITNLA